jgi:ribosome-associated protein
MNRLRDRPFERDFEFRTSRSSGKGGQNVNKTETKVELIFGVEKSQLLSAEEKEIISHKLSSRINEAGELLLNSSESRSQLANKEDVIKKFYALLEKALTKEKKRIPTKVPAAIKQDILNKKKQNSEKKSGRSMRTRDFL